MTIYQLAVCDQLQAAFVWTGVAFVAFGVIRMLFNCDDRDRRVGIVAATIGTLLFLTGAFIPERDTYLETQRKMASDAASPKDIEVLTLMAAEYDRDLQTCGGNPSCQTKKEITMSGYEMAARLRALDAATGYRRQGSPAPLTTEVEQ